MNKFGDDYVDTADHIVQVLGSLDRMLGQLPFYLTEDINLYAKTLRFALPNQKIDFFLKYSYKGGKESVLQLEATNVEEAFDYFCDLQRIIKEKTDALICYISYFGSKYERLIPYMNELNTYMEIMYEKYVMLTKGQEWQD